MRYDINDFNPPLKKPLPLFHFDVALYCAMFCDQIKVWPGYLTDFREKVVAYAKQVKRCQPKEETISSDVRIYIFDQRLSLLFAALDSTGKIATYISKFSAQYRKYDIERYCYGDGSKIGAAYPYKVNGELSFEFDWNELHDFNMEYGFVPIEDFAQPVVTIFQGDALVESRFITLQHCILLLEKFHAQNLVDLKAMIRDIPLT